MELSLSTTKGWVGKAAGVYQVPSIPTAVVRPREVVWAWTGFRARQVDSCK